MRKEKSCGCVVINDENKILMIRSKNEGIWGFPKGHVENGETEIETAIREVKEETNIDVEILENNRFIMNYIIKDTIDKEVVIFIAKKTSDNIIPQQEEVSEIRWFDIDEAIKIVNFLNTKMLLIDIKEKYFKNKNV